MVNGMFACSSRSATAGSFTRPSSMPRKITLLVVGMRLNTGAEPVGGSDTGWGTGCFGRSSPGTRSFGVVVVVVGGTVVGVVVVVGGVVVVDVVVVLAVVVVAAATSAAVPPTEWTAAAASGRAAPPLSSNGPAPNSSTSTAVTTAAVANRAHGGRACCLRARRGGADGELTRGTVLAAVRCARARSAHVRRADAGRDAIGGRAAGLGVRVVHRNGAPQHRARQARLRHDQQRARARTARTGRIRPRRDPRLRHRHARRSRR